MNRRGPLSKFAEGGGVDTATLRKQMEDTDSEMRNPMNWFGDRSTQLENKRRALRRSIAESYDTKVDPKAFAKPVRKGMAAGGSVDTATLRKQLEETDSAMSNPLNWFGERSDQLEAQRRALRRSIAESYDTKVDPKAFAKPARKGMAEGGSVTPQLLDAVRRVESGGNDRAVSPKGAMGPYQFMPATAKDLGLRDPYDPVSSRNAADRYLNSLLKETGNMRDALGAYNWGIGNMKKYGMRAAPAETKNYVDKVMALLGKDREKEPVVNIASAPINNLDTTPQEESEDGDAPSTEQVASVVAPSEGAVGGGGKLSAMSGYGKISGPPVSRGNNPMTMVSALLKDPMSLAQGEGQAMAKGGEVRDTIRSIPQNKILGALSRVLQGVDDFTQPAADVPYAGMLVPRFDNLRKVLEDVSYGMPLTTGKGLAGTLSVKPSVGMGALEASQLPGLGRAGVGAAKGLGRIAQEKLPGMVARQLERSPIAGLARPYAAAVKEQGGQWLPGSAKEFVADATRMRPVGVVDSWAEKQIPKYLEKYMGAKGDPLADVLVPHGREMKRWEELTDPLLRSDNIASVLERAKQPWNKGSSLASVPEWMNKLDPKTRLWGLKSESSGISPVQDYISHVLDHAKTIPPEKLNQYDFPRLVKEVQKIDAERAKKMASVEGRAEGTIKHKEYPEGFHWAEVQSSEALKREGDIMGHCVGSYCEDVKSGAKKIYSLRDPKGESHATVEVNPRSPYSSRSFTNAEQEILQNEVLKRGGGDKNVIAKEMYPELFPPTINQIKGKQNLAPKPEYQKYIQDLIKSGDYGDVRDLENAGLRKTSHVRLGEGANEGLAAKYGKYMTKEEEEDFLLSQITPGIPQMKKGGRVPHKAGGVCKCLDCYKKKYGPLKKLSAK